MVLKSPRQLIVRGREDNAFQKLDKEGEVLVEQGYSDVLCFHEVFVLSFFGPDPHISTFYFAEHKEPAPRIE